MSVLDGFINSMRLGENPEDYEDDSDFLDDPDEVENNTKVKSIKTDSNSDEQKKTPISKSSISRRAKTTGDGMRVCSIKPTEFEEVSEIVDTLRNNQTVILNLEGINNDLAQRIMDFVSGACYAIKGTFQKVSNFVFVITPPGVEVSGDFQGLDKSVFDV